MSTVIEFSGIVANNRGLANMTTPPSVRCAMADKAIPPPRSNLLDRAASDAGVSSGCSALT
jgi:hypothetical protein